eukprot:TRINITY_DN8493_c0_g1_i3.p1 TRINITY_DN8493_c0_g1~~TRINITY_DN8493_c0_g1_i3.p1  ORF type:complete len:488 (-),score=71.08 TRINITY_DN8493_c0_g1_i3:595-2058(-)
MRQILLINDGELDIIDAIGEGTTAQVYKGRFRTALVAVKQYTQRAFLPWELNTVVSYVEPLINIRHPSIVLYLGVYLDGCKLFIVEEYMEKGSLRDLLSNPNLKISSSIRTETWKSIIRGLMYLHSYDPLIVHPNFNSPNILISANWNAKISDFQIHPIEATRASPDLESEGIYWAAPETITSLEITPSSNVYSLGIVTWELLTRDMPYHDEPPSVDLAFQISGNGRRPEIPSSCHYDLRCCLERMWSNDQARRPSLDEIMEVVEIIEKDESIFSERSSKIVKLKMKESLSEQVQGFVIVCIRVLFQTSLKKLINCEQALAGTASTAFIEKLVHSFNGRIIPANQSFWWCEFKDTADAILFCCDALKELKQYHEEWKHSIHPNSTEQQENYECIVNIGIDKRWRLRDPNSSTSSREYSDKLPERAMALCKLCRGDQILCSSPIFSDFELNERRMPVHVKAKANTSNIQAYEVSIIPSRHNARLMHII